MLYTNYNFGSGLLFANWSECKNRNKWIVIYELSSRSSLIACHVNDSFSFTRSPLKDESNTHTSLKRLVRVQGEQWHVKKRSVSPGCGRQFSYKVIRSSGHYIKICDVTFLPLSLSLSLSLSLMRERNRPRLFTTRFSRKTYFLVFSLTRRDFLRSRVLF